MKVPILANPTNPVRARSESSERWQTSLKEAIRSGRELVQLLGLQQTLAPSAQAATDFPVFVTREFLSRIQPGDPADPLLRQVFPAASETAAVEGFGSDPLQEASFTRCGGLIHKYAGRVLLVTTGACAIHCRYCFRRHFPYSDIPHSIDQWQPALDEIADDESIEEVLLSGGDPLMLADPVLERLIDALQSIPHLRRLRIHSRLPIVLPSRVNDALVEMLTASRLTVWMVVHSNHANELDEAAGQGLGRLIDRGIPVLNQAVLLRGVNDDLDALTDLCRRLIDLRVTPYYLHKLDQVAGAAHFDVSKERGCELIEGLRTRLPGYAVPRFVIEQPDQPSKTTIV
ncbi:EF-P beta-lysylation protein EpmB [Rosistilla oblonga]|uniref:L-lysine 2,3-aminomutase n=1 Tax=Rosistilla oblonga TaxID=2527990 RepID=A0A518ISR5_9BACT|nr:EF-P beta-lysylation protein EpmB [Rosistilla oblonga]QDV56134.1 L-lysine 2,3-aminomutase [Rosistilla oblonga]